MKKTVEALINGWDYDQAVSDLRAKVEDWGNRTLICARALYVANLCLSAQGLRTDLVPNGTRLPDQPKTFRQFCEAVGIPKTTAYNWLACYDPDEDYLFEVEEVKAKLKEEMDKLFLDVYSHRQTESGWVPATISLKWAKSLTTWTAKLEDKYNVWLYENGHIAVNPHIKLPELPQADKYGQFGLWTDDYLDSLMVRCKEETSGEKAAGFYKTWSKYEPKIPKGVSAQDVMRVSAIAKASLRDLDETQRKETARLLAEMIIDIE